MRYHVLAAVLGCLAVAACSKSPIAIHKQAPTLTHVLPTWTYSSHTDPMTDEVTHFASKDGPTDQSWVTLACSKKVKAFLIHDDRIAGSGMSDVMLRFDNDKPETQAMLHQHGSVSVYERLDAKPSYKDLDRVLMDVAAGSSLAYLQKASVLRVRADGMNGPLDLTFDVRGADVAIKNLRAMCP